MASSKEYLEFVLEQLSSLDDVTTRAMMGEYLLYYRGRLFGGIYDDRLLVKPMPVARDYMPEADLQAPYEGAKEMLLVDDLDNADHLCGLVEAMYPHLPESRSKREHGTTGT